MNLHGHIALRLSASLMGILGLGRGVIIGTLLLLQILMSIPVAGAGRPQHWYHSRYWCGRILGMVIQTKIGVQRHGVVK